MKETATIETQLRNFFAKRKGVLLAYLFGSSVDKYHSLKKDIDVAVLLEPRELKHGVLKSQMKIFSQLSSLLKRYDIDVVILNDAPLLLQHEIIKHGKVLFEKNPQLRCDFEVRAELKYYDFKPIRDYFWNCFLQRLKEGKYAHRE